MFLVCIGTFNYSTGALNTIALSTGLVYLKLTNVKDDLKFLAKCDSLSLGIRSRIRTIYR